MHSQTFQLHLASLKLMSYIPKVQVCDEYQEQQVRGISFVVLEDTVMDRNTLHVIPVTHQCNYSTQYRRGGGANKCYALMLCVQVTGGVYECRCSKIACIIKLSIYWHHYKKQLSYYAQSHTDFKMINTHSVLLVKSQCNLVIIHLLYQRGLG